MHSLQCLSRKFVMNVKGHLWNSTQNILPVHWKIWNFYNIQILRALCVRVHMHFERLSWPTSWAGGLIPPKLPGPSIPGGHIHNCMEGWISYGNMAWYIVPEWAGSNDWLTGEYLMNNITENWELSWCRLLSLLGTLQVVVMTTWSTTSDDKVGILRILGF